MNFIELFESFNHIQIKSKCRTTKKLFQQGKQTQSKMLHKNQSDCSK